MSLLACPGQLKSVLDWPDLDSRRQGEVCVSNIANNPWRPRRLMMIRWYLFTVNIPYPSFPATPTTVTFEKTFKNTLVKSIWKTHWWKAFEKNTLVKSIWKNIPYPSFPATPATVTLKTGTKDYLKRKFKKYSNTKNWNYVNSIVVSVFVYSHFDWVWQIMRRGGLSSVILQWMINLKESSNLNEK